MKNKLDRMFLGIYQFCSVAIMILATMIAQYELLKNYMTWFWVLMFIALFMFMWVEYQRGNLNE